MKLKQLAAVALVAFAPLAHADVFNVGFNWSAFMPTEATNSQSPVLDDGEMSVGFDLYLEHAFPLVPNIQVDSSEIKGEDFKYLSTGATAYYRLLDGEMLGLDFGAGATFLHSGKVGSLGNSIGQNKLVEFDEVGAHAYVAGEIAMPFMPSVSLIGSAKKTFSGDLEGTDIKLGAQYTHNLDMINFVLQGGYRDVSHELDIESDKHKFDTSGYFASLGVNF